MVSEHFNRVRYGIIAVLNGATSCCPRNFALPPVNLIVPPLFVIFYLGENNGKPTLNLKVELPSTNESVVKMQPSGEVIVVVILVKLIIMPRAHV